MGCYKNIGFNTFPMQGDWLHSKVKVCFHYNTDQLMFGEIVRQDKEEPYKTIIKLDNGRYIEAGECQYSTI